MKNFIPPINPNATESAVHLYNFIQEVHGVKTLSGQHNFVGKGSEFTLQLEELTGKSPVVWGSDFGFTLKGDDAMCYQHCGPANLPVVDVEKVRKFLAKRNPDDRSPLPLEFWGEPEFLNITIEEARTRMIAEAKKRYARGHIITLMWHGCFPTDHYPCEGKSIWAEDNLPTVENWDQLVTEGTELNKAWRQEADKIAAYLKELQNEDIPVLWRPYHEMNGEWFWWGFKKGERGFKRLWLMMYHYFTEIHELNNLIWVWNPGAPRGLPGDKGIPYVDYFPGVENVDILAADIYWNEYKQSHHDDLVALSDGKPVALGEVGHIPSLEILDKQSQWSWFMSWGWILFLSNEPDFIKEVYDSDRVITLDQISCDKKGRYSLK